MNSKATWVSIGLSLVLPLTAMAADTAKVKSKKSAGADTYTLDPAASQISWLGKKVTGQHSGTVKLKSGQVQARGTTLTGGSFEVDMTSIANDDLKDPATSAKLVGHLKSDDFFAVDKFPTASFKLIEAKPIAASTAGGATHEVSGELTIKGQTHPVKFPATITVAGDKGEARANVMIDRTLYGIRYGSGKFFQNLGDKMIDDEFQLQLQFVASRG